MNVAAIQIWQHDIQAQADDYPEFWHLLSPDEQQHVEAISNQGKRIHFVESHARLRLLIANELNVKPAELRIFRKDHGKPFLVDYPGFEFNLSHTAQKLVVAYAWHQVIGVDIEVVKPRKNLAGLVDKCFAKEEQAYWQQLSESQQVYEFYRFWTRKEAFVKAVGRGIALGLEKCVVNPKDQSRFLCLPDEYGLAEEWCIQELSPAENIVGALAYKRI